MPGAKEAAPAFAGAAGGVRLCDGISEGEARASDRVARFAKRERDCCQACARREHRAEWAGGDLARPDASERIGWVGGVGVDAALEAVRGKRCGEVSAVCPGYAGAAGGRMALNVAMRLRVAHEGASVWGGWEGGGSAHRVSSHFLFAP